jgi:hypothetical protein
VCEFQPKDISKRKLANSGHADAVLESFFVVQFSYIQKTNKKDFLVFDFQG